MKHLLAKIVVARNRERRAGQPCDLRRDEIVFLSRTGFGEIAGKQYKIRLRLECKHARNRALERCTAVGVSAE